MKSPRSLQEDQLLPELHAQMLAHKPSIVFVGATPSFTQESIQQSLAVARTVAQEKRVPEDSRLRYIQRVVHCFSSERVGAVQEQGAERPSGARQCAPAQRRRGGQNRGFFRHI